ncbi:DUF58 domain-containing protein [Psychrobacter sp.]|uniref:DUF58 domain-containing protein n=1 Tax=Psychrobacter sp. TaxID=56811 RepID=UPI003BB1BBEE
MNQVLTRSQTQQQAQPKLSAWQRLRQYQPSARLIKIVLAWWLLLIVVTALDMTRGFGINVLNTSSESLYYLCYALLAGLVVICSLDVLMLMTLSQTTDYKIERKFPSNVPIYHDMDIEVLLSAAVHSGLLNSLLTMGMVKNIHIEFYDDYPDHLMLIDAMPIGIKLPLAVSRTDSKVDTVSDIGNSESQPSSITIRYPVVPSERGTGYFGVAYLRVWSPLKLFRRSLAVSADPANASQYLRVLADFSGLLNNQLSVIFERSVQAGGQALMQQGQGSDFLKLREYSVGDAIRQIDWKTSSRLRKLMSKAYEDENDQDVVFLLDCGEQMRHQDVYHNDSDIDEALHTDRLLWQSKLDGSDNMTGHASYFDKVLNAVLLLSYLANKQSDRVGLMTFGGVDIFLAPSKGTTLIRHLLNETADIKPTMQTGDYLIAAQELTKKLKKRSVVILVTNTRAEATEELTQAVNLLSKRHQVVFANLIEQVVVDRLYGDTIPKSMDDALLYHSLVDYQQGRQQLQQLLSQKTGALCLQTTANHLPSTLTQAYLSLKRR